MNKLIAWIHSTKKWKVFLLMLLVILILGTAMSWVAHAFLIKDDIGTRPRIAVVTPANNVMGAEFKKGIQLYLDEVNRTAKRDGRRLIELFEVEETSDAAEKVIADKRVVAVVGHLDFETLKKSAEIYRNNHIPVITPLFVSDPIEGVTTLSLDLKDQARFIANYARNIQQQRLMYVIREDHPELDALVEPFVNVYNRFETPVKKVWTISSGANSDEQLKKVIEEVKNIDIGGIYIATSAELAARIVKEVRATGNTLEIYGTAQLALNSFANSAIAQTPKDTLALTHGIIMTTPVLFDTANEEAQNFQSHYQQKFGQSPDWVATYAYDIANIALSAKQGLNQVKGILGMLNFENNRAQIPIQVGIYNGDRLISAPIQLLPIAKGANFNYIEALRQGRVLYVNDRFMFKTNVVYAGITLNGISDVDQQKETATLDMSIWFRYRGNFSPQDLQIENALEPIKLDTPVEIEENEDVQYRRYRIKQKFKLNFTEAKRAYGQHIAGISFRHRQLNRNNLMYVVDVLGMPTGNELIKDLHQRKVVQSNMGWVVDNAWESQDIISENGEGVPRYVGKAGEQPLFSKITFGALLKPTTSARDLVSGEYFIYIAIFGILGSGFALALDFARSGRFWAMQSWLLRLIFWPLVLISVGNLTLDWAFTSLSSGSTRIFVIVYESLWWLLGAELLDIGVRRFVWEPLAKYADSKVPNVIKLFVTILIFSFAFSGILVVVFNQSPTSLLATSGVLAMVVGMAVKDIIANVFSGIILNFERPFTVGDKIKINTVTGIVKDITWRTTRVESSDGHMVSLANGKVTEAFMENYSQAPNGVLDEVHFYTPPTVDPKVAIPIIMKAVEIFGTEVTGYNPKVNYKGIINVNGDWVADFAGTYRLAVAGRKSDAKENICLYVREAFIKQGIPLIPTDETFQTSESMPLQAKNVNLSKDK